MAYEKSLYDQLLSRKKRGEQLDFTEITREELYKLWYTESNSDSAIGDLYNVTKCAVRLKRGRMDMKMYDVEL